MAIYLAMTASGDQQKIQKKTSSVALLPSPLVSLSPPHPPLKPNHLSPTPTHPSYPVQEARALDSKERLNKKMVSCADHESAVLVAKICDEEVRERERGNKEKYVRFWTYFYYYFFLFLVQNIQIKHVKFGVKWLEYLAKQRGVSAKTLYQEVSSFIFLLVFVSLSFFFSFLFSFII